MFSIHSILKLLLSTDDGGFPASDPNFAAYPDNPPAPGAFDIPKGNSGNAFTALGLSQAQAGLPFAPVDPTGGAGLGPDSARPALWPGPTTPGEPTSDGGQSQTAAKQTQDNQVLSGTPALPNSADGLSWMSPGGMNAPTPGSVPTAFTKTPDGPPVYLDITKQAFENVFTALGGTLEQADLVFSQLDVDNDGILQMNELKPVRPVAPALTATNGPAGPAGLAAPGMSGSDSGVPTLLGNPPPFPVR